MALINYGAPISQAAKDCYPTILDQNLISTVYTEQDIRDEGSTNHYVIRAHQFEFARDLVDVTHVNYRDLVWGLTGVTRERNIYDGMDCAFRSRKRGHFIEPEDTVEYELLAYAAKFDVCDSPLAATRTPYQRWHREALSLTTRPVLDLMREKPGALEIPKKFIHSTLYEERVEANRYAEISLTLELYNFMLHDDPLLMINIENEYSINHNGLHWRLVELSLGDSYYDEPSSRTTLRLRGSVGKRVDILNSPLKG